MARLRYLSHPEVVIDPDVPVPNWGLNDLGRARLARLAASGWLAGVGTVVASTETKAVETAEALGLPFATDPDLGEIDRSATGYLPGPEFEAVADAFFAAPGTSIRGWERAVDAQARVVRAVGRHLDGPGDILICGHGGVGTLLYCHLAGLQISRRWDQPAGGGCWFTAPVPPGKPDHPWRKIEDILDGIG